MLGVSLIGWNWSCDHLWTSHWDSVYIRLGGYPGDSDVKNLPAVQETWVGKIFWKRKWQPIPVFLPGKFHGHPSLEGKPMGLQRAGYDWVITLYKTWSYAQFMDLGDGIALLELLGRGKRMRHSSHRKVVMRSPVRQADSKYPSLRQREFTPPGLWCRGWEVRHAWWGYTWAYDLVHFLRPGLPVHFLVPCLYGLESAVIPCKWRSPSECFDPRGRQENRLWMPCPWLLSWASIPVYDSWAILPFPSGKFGRWLLIIPLTLTDHFGHGGPLVMWRVWMVPHNDITTLGKTYLTDGRTPVFYLCRVFHSWHCWYFFVPVHCRMLGSIPGLYPWDASRTLYSCLDNPECSQTVSSWFGRTPIPSFPSWEPLGWKVDSWARFPRTPAILLSIYDLFF